MLSPARGEHFGTVSNGGSTPSSWTGRISLMASSKKDTRTALDLVGAARIAELSQLRDGPGLVRLASHLGLICACAVAVALTEGWVRLLFQFLLGVPLVFLFTLLHETIHRTPFRTGWLNDLLGMLIGAFIFVPALWFRYFHLAHHRHTQDPEQDPELGHPPPRTRLQYCIHLSGLHLWTGMAKTIVGIAFGSACPAFVPQRAESRVRWEARAHLSAYITIATACFLSTWTEPLEYWLTPMLLAQPVLRAYLLAEHTACPMVPDMLRNTRTTYTHRAIRWLAWEMPWHTAHHAAPTVPFHRLRDLTRDIEHHIGTTADGFPDAHRQILTDMMRRNTGLHSPATKA